MALILEYDAQEAIPEAIRSEFARAEDGKWRPKEIKGDLPGFEPRAKVNEFRETNIALLKEKEQWAAERKRWEGLGDPEAARQALAKVKDFETKKLTDAGQYEQALEAAKAAMAEDKEAAVTAVAKERDTLRTANETLVEQIFTLTVNQDVRGVWGVAELGLEPTAMADALTAARCAFRRDEKGQHIPHDYDGTFGPVGQKVYGPKGEPATAREWVEKLLPFRPHWKIKSTGVGDLGHPAGGGLKGEDLMKLTPAERMNRGRQVVRAA